MLASLESLSLRFLLNFSSHNGVNSGRSYIVMMCLIILQGNGKVAMIISVHITSDTASVWYFPDEVAYPCSSSLTLPLPKKSEVFFCMQALQTMSYCSYCTGMLNWFIGFCFLLQSYEQYYTVNTSQVKKVMHLNSEYFCQMGFQHNIVTITWLVKKSTLRPQCQQTFV